MNVYPGTSAASMAAAANVKLNPHPQTCMSAYPATNETLMAVAAKRKKEGSATAIIEGLEMARRDDGGVVDEGLGNELRR